MVPHVPHRGRVQPGQRLGQELRRLPGVPDAQAVPGIVEPELVGGPALGRVVGVGHRVQVFRPQPSLLQAPGGRQLRQLPGRERHRPLAVLAPAEPFLLRGSHDPPVHDQRGRGVVEDRVDSEHPHQAGTPVSWAAAGAGAAAPARGQSELVGEPGQRAAEPGLPADLRCPAELLAGQRDVRATAHRVVLRQRDVHDRGLRPGQRDDPLGDLQHGGLVRVPDVHRPGPVAGRHGQDAAHGVVHMAQRPGLVAVPGHGERVAPQGLAGERGHDPAVTGPHPRPVGVEDPHDRGVHGAGPAVRGRQGLGEPLGLVVDAARPDRVDVAPVAFGLRAHRRVAVHLRSRGEHEPGPGPGGQLPARSASPHCPPPGWPAGAGGSRRARRVRPGGRPGRRPR